MAETANCSSGPKAAVDCITSSATHKPCHRATNSRRQYKLILLLPLLIITAAPRALELTPNAPWKDLAGHWQLDVTRSDDAPNALSAAARELIADLQPTRPPGPIRPDPTGLYKRQSSRALSREIFSSVLLPTRSLELTCSAQAVDFHRDGSPPERIWTDQRPSVVDTASPDARTGAWDAGILWIERSSSNGTHIVETWQRKGPDLVAEYEIHVHLLEKPVTFQLVFTPAPAE